MDYLLYGITGFVAAFLGALPPGAVNLSVVYTTINRGARYVIPVVLVAAIGEIILSYFALHCTMAVEEYIRQNVYLQYVIALALIVAGLILLLKKPGVSRPATPKQSRGFLKGLLLAVLNPPVLVFWLVAFAYISMHTPVMVQMGVVPLVIVFFLGIFAGKVIALWLYVQLSKRIASNASDIAAKLNKVIGGLLAVIGLFQLAKLLL